MIRRLPALPRPFGFGGLLALLLVGLVLVAGIAVGVALIGEPEIERERPLHHPGSGGTISGAVSTTPPGRRAGNCACDQRTS